MIEIVIPQLSENLTSGTVVTVSVKAGDTITPGQTLLEMETEKALLEVPSPVNGTLTEVLIHPGDVVSVGQIVFRASSDIISGPRAQPAAPPVSSTETSSALSSESKTKIDAGQTSPDHSSASPAARRLARETGLDIEKVPGTGAGGRITQEDVEKAAGQEATRPGLPEVPPEKPGKPLPDFSLWGPISAEPMSLVRKTIAEKITEAWTAIPHVTHFAKADLTSLEKLRSQFATEGRKMSVLPFMMKIIAHALKEFPRFNASIDMVAQRIIYKKYYNIGVAVDTDYGLMVPVIRHVDEKSIPELADEIKTVADRARARQLTLEQLAGGTFTVTNLGSITGGYFTPIIRSPEVAILGLSQAAIEPCYHKDGAGPTPKLLLPLSLSYDHRLIDGADAAKFIKWICEATEDPAQYE